ncbi:Eukaryotic mitochondrial regulator domain containing protein [Amanita muscaria]
MFLQTRFARRVLCPHSPFRILQTRQRLSVHRHNSSLAPEPPLEDSADSSELPKEEPLQDTTIEAEDVGEDSVRPESYGEFIKAVGGNFRHASPRNWLGGEVPFPMNPSFIPPAPLPDALRTRIYREFMQDPVKNSVRVLSQKYHISLKRVDAILRLKGQENVWTKGKQLQTGFQEGMERLLGVKEDERMRTIALRQKQKDWTRYDAHEADILEQEENRDAARQRYQRSYWESVPESGGEPVVPPSLEHARQKAKNFANKALESNTSRIRDTEFIKTPQEKTQVVTKLGRPAFEFHDVGSKFLDSSERAHRMAIAERRARVRKEKRVKEAAIPNY